MRPIKMITQSFPAMDGDGVALLRNDLFDGRLDPFLMLDELKAKVGDNPKGFPVHPHRGIQTLSYIIDGTMAHKDSLGTESKILAGGLQWMHTGQGIEHSEQPGLDAKGLWGFQFWLNVPRAEKYQAPSYQDVPASQTQCIELEGAQFRVLAGDWQVNNNHYQSTFNRLSGQGALADVSWTDSLAVSIQTTATTLACYVLTGEVQINQSVVAKAGQLVQFGTGSQVVLNGGLGQSSAEDGRQAGRVLLFKGEPIGEPIYHRGPFVMTTEAEMKETIRAYQMGTLVKTPL